MERSLACSVVRGGSFLVGRFKFLEFYGEFVFEGYILIFVEEGKRGRI